MAENCRAGGYNLANLQWYGPGTNHIFSLQDGKATQMELLAPKDTIYKFSVTNPVNENCGRARITLFQQQKIWLALSIFSNMRVVADPVLLFSQS